MVLPKTGDVEAFDKNWRERAETYFTHWTRKDPANQIQLAFRNHWTLFQELQSTTVDHNRGRRVLEVGCGRGSLSCYYADAGYECELIDLSPKAIEVASKIFASHNLQARFAVGDANALPYKDGSFDLVFSIGLLEHFEDISKPLSEQVRILSPGGLFIGYVVPHYSNNIQAGYYWINEVLQGYHEASGADQAIKAEVFRSDLGSERYVPILKTLGLHDVKASGVYPLPMISHSIDFPFSLMPPKSELAITKHFENLLQERKKQLGHHPWLCKEGYGQAFLVWGVRR
jgi:ubiquinone/menaquinone biosynthesis C-methylase UbiE